MAKRKRTPYHVFAYPGDFIGKFSSDVNAQRVAQMWSARWGSWAEVICVGKHDGAGLIGQYHNGRLTPEFAHVAKHIQHLKTTVTEDSAP